MKLQHKAAYLVLFAVVTSVFVIFSNPPTDIFRTARSGRQLLRQVYSRSGVHGEPKENGVHAYKNNSIVTSAPEVKVIGNFEQEPLYRNYDEKKPRYVTLKDDETKYFRTSGNVRCLIEGTLKVHSSSCKCQTGWHGEHCSIPDIVDEKSFSEPERLKLRHGSPRRIIYGITFNMEFEMLEIRLAEMGDLIDVILVVESNFTGFGKKKALVLLDKMRNGFLKDYQEKIVHVFLDFFPTNGDPKDGGFTDFFTKSYPSKKGLSYLNGTRKDDLFIFADADEIHKREALLFLKVHDGYPEPFGIIMKRSCFGFFWNSGESHLGIGCSLAMLQVVYDNKCGEIRGATSDRHLYHKQLQKYKKAGHYVQMWHIGQSDPSLLTGGWHCSWCFEPERVRTKLVSAFNYDFPRWGNFPEKLRLDYIQGLIKDGMWFDGQGTFKPQYVGLNAPYAPTYAIKNPSKYKDMLFNPYRPM